MRNHIAVQHGQRHGYGNAVVAAKRRAVCRDVIALDAQFERVLCEINGAFRRLFRDHVEMALQNDGGRGLIASRGGLFDDDVVKRVLIHPQAAFLGKRNAVVADGLCVARAVRDAGQVFKEMKYRLGFQIFQYTGHDDRSFPFLKFMRRTDSVRPSRSICAYSGSFSKSSAPCLHSGQMKSAGSVSPS